MLPPPYRSKVCPHGRGITDECSTCQLSKNLNASLSGKDVLDSLNLLSEFTNGLSTRTSAFRAIDLERRYQDAKWHHRHELESFLTYITSYIREAQELLSRNEYQEVQPQCCDILRKIAALAVAAMEEHGVQNRPDYTPAPNHAA